MHKVAILKVLSNHSDYDYEYNSTVAAYMTDWEEIGDDEYKLLLAAAKGKANNNFEQKFVVLEQLKSDSPLVVNSISSYLAEAAKEKEKEEAAQAKRRAATQARKEKKMMKEEKSRMELFLKLKDEFPNIA